MKKWPAQQSGDSQTEGQSVKRDYVYPKDFVDQIREQSRASTRRIFLWLLTFVTVSSVVLLFLHSAGLISLPPRALDVVTYGVLGGWAGSLAAVLRYLFRE